MPWNSQGGGGWQGGQGPWGGRPGGGQQPPDLEELIRRSQEKVKNLFPRGRGGGGTGSGPSPILIGIVGVVLLVLWLFTGVYRVQPDERGVRLLFGRQAGAPTEPGLHFWWPSPIGSVLTPQVSRVNRIEVGFRANLGTRGTAAREVEDESLMLTGDENIIDINFVVLWKINDPAAYLFNVRDPEATVKAASESVMREIIGQTPIAEASTEARRSIEIKAGEQLQALLDSYGAGILIDEVQLQKADPPSEVIDAFRDVQRAQADRERLQNEAETFANDIIPRARGEAERLLQEAQAYRQEAVARATGGASRFEQVLGEYEKVPDVTRKRIYIETMEGVLKNMNKVILDEGAGGSGVVPYLPLGELQHRAPSGAGREEPPAFGAMPTGAAAIGSGQ
ncbi:MAG: FtsH protease activity modulator HflK [Geminicoccaceae bacterium]|nr:FtsH protease activity modulator HflK [Geminicoccaceae bacterium]